jgi:hypothetical protein
MRESEARDRERVTLRLPEDLARRIAVIARYNERTLNAELIRAIRFYVEHEEKEMTQTADHEIYALRPGERAARRTCNHCGSRKTAWEPREEWVAGHATLRCRMCGNVMVTNA